MGTHAVQVRHDATWVKKSVLATTENQSAEDTATAQASTCKHKPSKDALGSFPSLTPRHQAGHWVLSSALLTGSSKSAPMPRTSSASRLSRSGGCQQWERSSQPNQLALEPDPLSPGNGRSHRELLVATSSRASLKSPSPRESPSPPKGHGEPLVHHEMMLVCSSQGW